MNSLQPAVQSVCTGDGKVKIERSMAIIEPCLLKCVLLHQSEFSDFSVSLNWGCRELRRWIRLEISTWANGTLYYHFSINKVHWNGIQPHRHVDC